MIKDVVVRIRILRSDAVLTARPALRSWPSGESTRRKVGCGAHAVTGWLHELPITRFNSTVCRHCAKVPPVHSRDTALWEIRTDKSPSIGDPVDLLGHDVFLNKI